MKAVASLWDITLKARATSNWDGGVRKASVAEQLKQLTNAGHFYVQHGLILLAAGAAANLSRKGVSDVQKSATLGEGSHRVLKLLVQQDLQIHLKGNLANKDYEVLALRERNRFRACAEKVFGSEDKMPSVVRKNACGKYLLLPESFGDFLCKGAQILRCLLGRKKPHPLRLGDGWSQGKRLRTKRSCV